MEESHYVPLTGSQLTSVHEVLELSLGRYEDKTAVRFFNVKQIESYHEVTYGELWRDSLAVAGGLSALGVGEGDRVAIMMDNCVEWVELWFACSMLRAVVVPINTHLLGSLLTYTLRSADPALIVAGADNLQNLMLAMPDGDRKVVVVARGTADPPGGSVVYDQLVAGSTPLGEPVPGRRSQLVALLYTSGTTGPSKGNMFSHGTTLGFADSVRYCMQNGPDDVTFTCLPLFHGNALLTSLMPGLLGGGTIGITERFSASTYWQQITAAGATLTNMLGSIASILWKREPSPLETEHGLRLAQVVPLPTKTVSEFEKRFNVRSTEVYGSTDVGMPMVTPFGETRPDGSCGKVVPGWHCEVFGPDDRPVANGTRGELVVRPLLPDLAPMGYWRMPEATVEAWRGLWIHTGDEVSTDDDGWWYFVGRLKDALRRSGENISAFEVETVLMTHPAIGEAAVYAVPSELTEDEVMASITLLPGADVTMAEFTEFCETNLPYFAVPRFVRLLDDLPRTPSQKVQKNVLREDGRAMATWDLGPRSKRGRAGTTGSAA